jgi:hypothetical protein
MSASVALTDRQPNHTTSVHPSAPTSAQRRSRRHPMLTPSAAAFGTCARSSPPIPCAPTLDVRERSLSDSKHRNIRRAVSDGALFDRPSNDVPDDHRELQVPDGTRLDVATSALQKSIRRGEEADAAYWALQIERRYPWHLWRRLAIIACEDVGLGEPRAIVVVESCRSAYAQHLLGPERRKSGSGASRGRPDGDLLVFPVLFMCRANKNREADHLKNAVEMLRQEGWRPPVGDHVLDVHTAEGRKRYEQTPHREIERLWYSEWSKVENEVGPHDWRDWHLRRLEGES